MNKLVTYTMLLSLLSLTTFAQLVVPTTPQNRGAFIESYMGIHAPFCPDASRIADDIRALNPNVTFVEFHEGPYADPGSSIYHDLRTSIGGNTFASANITGIPQGAVNREVFPSEISTAILRSKWSPYSSTVTSSPSPVNIVADGFYDAVTGKLTVHVAMYYTASVSTPHYLNVYLVQDNIIGYQSGGSSYPARVTGSGDYIHNDVFRDALTGQWGTLLTGTTAGNRIDKSFNYTPTTINGIPFVPADMKIVAFISEGNSYSKIVTATNDDDVTVGAFPIGSNYSIGGTTMLGGDTTKTDLRRVYLIQQDTSYSVPFLVATDSMDTRGKLSVFSDLVQEIII